MKIVSNVLESVDGIQVWYVLGLLIFLALFIVIVIRTWRRPAKEMVEIKESILNDNEPEEIIVS